VKRILAFGEVDTLLFGRVTYEGMASYWPTPAAEQDDPDLAARMNGLEKVVVSRTLDKVEWARTRLFNDRISEQLTELRQQPGKDIAILGSAALTASLLEKGLVDELRIMVAPVILGAGTSLFRTAERRVRLRLIQTRQFNSGNVLLVYEPWG
jgi:dihydrofolate reductase